MINIINDLVIGELQQMKGSSSKKDPFNSYLTKSYNKTASLIANSCKAVAHIALQHENKGNMNQNTNILQSAFLYGKNLGMAFQLMDDCLDFSASADLLGKPAAADLK